MSNVQAPPAAATGEPQQQSPSTEPAPNTASTASSTTGHISADKASTEKPSNPELINLMGNESISDPVQGDFDTAGIDKKKWQPNPRAHAFYWQFFWKSIGGKAALCLICRKRVSATSPSNLALHHQNQHHALHPAYMDITLSLIHI